MTIKEVVNVRRINSTVNKKGAWLRVFQWIDTTRRHNN